MVSEIVTFGAKDLNIDLPPKAGAAFDAYFSFLERQGSHFNLTAISGADEVARLHFLDCLAVLTFTQFKDTKVIDVGSGAGFPGLPLKIAEPSIDLTTLDATGKRVTFLSELCSLIGIDATCLHARAEDAAFLPELREQFDIALSRAVAELNVLCELCLPFVAIGGLFIAMKGLNSDEELLDAHNAIIELGAKISDCINYKIPGTSITHRAILIKKVAETPKKYPRRFAAIKRNPL